MCGSGSSPIIRETPKPAGEVPPPRLVPLARPGESRRRDRAWRWLAAAAAIVAVAFFSLWAIDRGDSGPELDTAALAQEADTAAGAQHAVLRADDGTALARAVVLPDGTGYLTSTNLPRSPTTAPTSCGVSATATRSRSA